MQTGWCPALKQDITSATLNKNKNGTANRALPTGRRPRKALPPSLKMAPAEGAEYHWVVMAASRLELNLVRLLCRCEAMAAEKRDPDEWRLEKVGNSVFPRKPRIQESGPRS